METEEKAVKKTLRQKIRSFVVDHHVLIAICVFVLLEIKSCRMDTERRTLYIENIKANEYNKGFDDGFDACMNRMVLDESK